MINIRFEKNGIFHKDISLEKPLPIRQLIAGENFTECEKLIFIMNNEHVDENTYIFEDCMLNMQGLASLEGHRIYQDTAIFIMMKAFYISFPKNLRVIVEHAIADGVYCEVFGGYEFTEADATRLQTEMEHIVKRDLPIRREPMDITRSTQIFEEMSRKDIIRNFHYARSPIENIYSCGQFYDYYIRQLAQRTGLIQEFKVEYLKPGFILRFPQLGHCKVEEDKVFPQKLFNVHQEHDKWLNILHTHAVYDLNKRIEEYDILEMIQTEEALHEKKIANFADYIKEKQTAKIILIAGPSSSGKTTFAKRLSVQLRVNGLRPVVMGLDDYFLPRALTPHKENGDYDYENIEALDLALLNEHLQAILAGDEVRLPRYNFITGNREKGEHSVRLKPGQIIVMEGIHGINERLTSTIPPEMKIKIYISCLNQLNIDDHNRIPTTDSRKLRRISRDYQYRGYSAEDTLQRWEDIREGEEKHIFPFQEEADLTFNSGLTYEIGVLKKYTLPLLKSISRFSPAYLEAKRLACLLNHILDIPDEYVPSNSVLREFTKGSIFKY